jgi:hypothetical protein
MEPYRRSAVQPHERQEKGGFLRIFVFGGYAGGIPRSSSSITFSYGRIAMTTRYVALCTIALVGPFVLGSPSAQALTMKECSAKYKANQAAGTLKGMKWNDFRKAECGTDASAAPAPTPATATKPAAAPSPAAAPKPAVTTTAKPAAAPTPAPAATGNAVFPNGVSPKYSSEPAGKARLHTCLDQYNANKANNANGGLVWIQKGGGYYSECNKRLKG